jgi:hypothetical protein
MSMANKLRRIPFEEFSDNLVDIFEQVIHEQETVLIENEHGELVELKPVTPISSQNLDKAKEDEEAFLSSAGAWADVDIDTFLKDNAESRRLSTRPPVEL